MSEQLPGSKGSGETGLHEGMREAMTGLLFAKLLFFAAAGHACELVATAPDGGKAAAVVPALTDDILCGIKQSRGWPDQAPYASG